MYPLGIQALPSLNDPSNPDQKDWLRFQSNGHSVRTELLAGLKRYEECEQAVEERLALPGTGPQTRGYCGYLLAFCSRYTKEKAASTRMAKAALPELLSAWSAGHTFMPPIEDGVYDRLRSLPDYPALERAAKKAMRPTAESSTTGK